MQSLSFFVLFFLSFLYSVQAVSNIAFYFVNGFQTKNVADTYYLTFSATTDIGAIASTYSNAIPFDAKFNMTVKNCSQYVTNVKASLINFATKQTVATFTDETTKFYSNNFFIIAHTDSYDPVTGANTPKLTAVSGNTDSPYTVSIVSSYFFYSPQTNYGYFTGPYSYPVYYFPYGTPAKAIYPDVQNYVLQYGSSRTDIATSTNSLIYINGSASSSVVKFCSFGICASAGSDVFAGSGQMFASIYYGNDVYGQTGRIAFLTPPNTLSLN